MTVIGHDPVIMLEAPIPATLKALDRAGLKIDDIDLYEVNEAFASVPTAWLQVTGGDPDKLNVHGGAIALGHPLGGSGAKLMTTLVPRDARPRRAVRAADDVRRRRAGERDDRGAAVTFLLPLPGRGETPSAHLSSYGKLTQRPGVCRLEGRRAQLLLGICSCLTGSMGAARL
jgi:hypothetical protein